MSSNYNDRIKDLARRLSEEVSIDIAQELMQEFKRAGFLDPAYYVYLDILTYLNAHLSDKLKYEIEFIKKGDKLFKSLGIAAKSEDPLLSVKFVDYSSGLSSNYEYSLLMCKSTEKDVQFSGLMKLWISNGLTKSQYRYGTNKEDHLFRIRNSQDLEEGLGFFCNTSLYIKEIPRDKMIHFIPFHLASGPYTSSENSRGDTLRIRDRLRTNLDGEQQIVVIPSITEYTANRMPRISQMMRRGFSEPEQITHRVPLNYERFQNPDHEETFEVDEDQTVESRHLNDESRNLNEEYVNQILGEVEEGTFGASRIRPPSSETLNPSSTTDKPSSEEKGVE